VLQRADWDCSPRSIDGDAATITVRYPDYVVNVGKTGQNLCFYAPHSIIDSWRNALDRGRDPENVLRPRASVNIPVTVERVIFKQREWHWHGSTQPHFVEWRGGRHVQHLLPKPRTGFYGPIRVPDDLAIPFDGLAFLEVMQSNLVRLRDPLRDDQTRWALSSVSCTLGIDNNSNVVALVNDYV
jgi:hypothetical protein